ncbi:MAG: DUF6055 domain-containing protein [Phycisphaerae bacterium]|jgi:hypothetical protein|nr:DUF6055 domain-containing protein [Phycisphaerae bacterium]
MRFQRYAILALFAIPALSYWTSGPHTAQCLAAEPQETQTKGYDFFDLSRYPVEGKLRPWVELRKVTLEGDGDPKKYNRRTVQWWPRKGVDFTELRDGMIEREWTLAASAMDGECSAGVVGEKETKELDSLSLEPNAGSSFIRRVRGFITPSESGQYTFKIAADDEGYVYLSTDDTPAAARAVCYQKLKVYPGLWTTYQTQTSAPQKLEKGKKYYYEIVHIDHKWRDHCDVVWSSETRAEGPLKGDEFSTLDGGKGKFIVEKWNFKSGDGELRLPGEPVKFKAHLVGFMGLGNELGEPYEGQEFVAPGVVLRFPNGRKRVLHRWVLSAEDQRFAMDLYVKEMKRIRATLDQTEFTGGEGPAPLGRELYTSPHFVFSYAAGPKEEDPKAKALRNKFNRSAVVGAEHWYTYLEHGGHLMQYWDRKEKRKHNVHVGGGNGGGYGGCTIGGVSALPVALFHEYCHGFNLWWFGHPEIFCDFGQVLGTGGTRIEKAWNNVRRPYLSALHGAYPTCLFLSVLGEDPNWGYCSVVAMPKSDAEQNFFQTLARITEQRGIAKKGVPGAGDIVGDYGARLAEFDMQNHNLLKSTYFAVARDYVEAMDVKTGRYRIVWDKAPEPYGTNVIRLVAEPGAREITVDFQGYHDPSAYSDWRACIVAVDKDGLTRYSDMWNKGVMSMPRRQGDRRYWLSVTAAPTGILNIRSPLRVCSGHYCPRYPWRMTLKGARPGTPHRVRFDSDDYYADYGSSMTLASIVPTPPNTPERKLFVDKVRKARQAVLAKIPTVKDPYLRHRLMATLARMDNALLIADGAPHPNGGGWVASSAKVAATAYVGPGAMVIGQAAVLDNACVEEYAVVKNNARLSGDARVGGQAFVGGSTNLSGYQRGWMPEATSDHGLWQNYALDEASVMMLEDRYRSHGVKNGYVRGAPKLIVDGDRRAFQFDGKTQYLDLNARAADMGQITVDIAVRPAGQKQQALWDFGSDTDNCMTLKIALNGKPEFAAKVGGKTVVSLMGEKALTKNEWVRLRVEIDGKRIALWVNDRLSVGKASTFRPADVFPPGLQKRNFVAVSRDMKGHFAGAIDYVVIYHRVHGEAFAKLPPPIIDASRRPTQRFANELMKDRAARKRYEIENKRAVNEAMLYYRKLAADIVIRLHELRNRDPNWPKALAKAKEDLANIGKSAKQPKRAKSEKEIAPPPQLAELRKKRETLQKQITVYAEKEKQYRKDEAEWINSIKDPKYLQFKAAQQAGREKLDKLAKQVAASFEAMPEEVTTKKKIAELTARRAELDDTVKKVNATVDQAVAKMPVYWDTGKIQAENRFLQQLRVQYEGEHGGGDGGAIQSYRAWRERGKHMAGNSDYRKAVEIDRELEVLKALSPVHRQMHNAAAREYNALRSELQGKDSPGSRANEILGRLRKERRDRVLGTKYDRLRKQREALDREIRDLQRQYDQKRRQRDAGARRQQELRREEIRKELFEAYNKAVEPHYAEYHAGVSYLRSAMRGFYNTPYSQHLSSQGLARKTYRYRDEPGGDMQTAIDAYRPENWKTDVRAWDWRTRWERDGTISQYPMTRQWLKRVRGDGPINVVDRKP